MGFATFGIAFAVSIVSAIRWLRVAQREHYIPGSCATVAWRWFSRRPPNQFLGPLALLTLAAVPFTSGTPQVVLELLAAGLALAFPWGMSIRGRSAPLRFTRRARVLAAVLAAVAAVALGLLSTLTGWAAGMAVVALLIPFVTDLAAAVTAPVERRLLENHRRRAETKLRKVAPKVVAITGSWGKTSTKNHLADLLSYDRQTLATPASWNNTAGLSRAINEQLLDDTEIFIAEMGMYGPGEIREMCGWVRPSVGVIVAVGPMHMERAGSIEAIASAKAEILETVSDAVLWVDNPYIRTIADNVGQGSLRVWRVGSGVSENLDVRVAVEGPVVSYSDGEGVLGAIDADAGLHSANVACAVATALAMGVDRSTISRRLQRIQAPPHRAQAIRGDGPTLIDDTFSSNPEGAAAAVRMLAAVEASKRFVVTPGMVELGDAQSLANEHLGRAVADIGATLVAVGWTNRRALLRGAGEAPTVLVRDRDAAREWVRTHAGSEDAVLWENDLPDHYP